jgi:hypothetical protein
MSIKRINEFPEGSGSLSNDDVFLFMDDPSNGGTTKKISLSQVAGSIWNSDLPTIINANVSIKTDTKNDLNSYILSSGELAYAIDEGTLRIGNGTDPGGSKVINGETYFVSETNTNAYISSAVIRNNVLTYSSDDLDPIIKFTIINPTNKISYFRGNCKAAFLNIATNNDFLPEIYIYNSGIKSDPFKHSLSTIDLSLDGTVDSIVSKISPGDDPPLLSSAYGNPVIAPSSSSAVFFYETDTFYFRASGLCTVGLAWGCSGSGLRAYGSLEITRIK